MLLFFAIYCDTLYINKYVGTALSFNRAKSSHKVVFGFNFKGENIQFKVYLATQLNTLKNDGYFTLQNY